MWFCHCLECLPAKSTNYTFYSKNKKTPKHYSIILSCLVSRNLNSPWVNWSGDSVWLSVCFILSSSCLYPSVRSQWAKALMGNRTSSQGAGIPTLLSFKLWMRRLPKVQWHSLSDCCLRSSDAFSGISLFRSYTFFLSVSVTVFQLILNS